MKILQIVNKLCIGGMQRFVLDLSQELGINHDVTLITLYDESYDQINISNPNFSRIALNKNRGLDISLFFKIRKIIKKEKPEIVHTHMMSLLYVVPSIFIHPHDNIIYVHTIHNVADKEINQIDFIKRRLYGKHVCAVSISDRVYKSVKDYYHNIDTPLIDNGASAPIVTDVGNKEVEDVLSKSNLNSDYPLMITLGHISDSKNQVLLNQAVKILYNRGYKFNVIIIGRDGEIEYAKKLKQELSPNVICIGESSNPGAWLNKADFFVMPSKSEG